MGGSWPERTVLYPQLFCLAAIGVYFVEKGAIAGVSVNLSLSRPRPRKRLGMESNMLPNSGQWPFWKQQRRGRVAGFFNLILRSENSGRSTSIFALPLRGRGGFLFGPGSWKPGRPASCACQQAKPTFRKRGEKGKTYLARQPESWPVSFSSFMRTFTFPTGGGEKF